MMVESVVGEGRWELLTFVMAIELRPMLCSVADGSGHLRPRGA